MLQKQIESFNLYDKVAFHPLLAAKDLIEFISKTALGLVIIEPDCTNRIYALPNKFFEYIMAGVTVLASAIKKLNLYHVQW